MSDKRLGGRRTLKISVLIAIILLFASNTGSQILKTFDVLNPQVRPGDVLIVKISPQWMPPATSNPAISIEGVRYYPNKYGEVYIGINLNTQPDKYIAIFTENGQRSGWDYEEVEVVEKKFSVRNRGVFTPTQKWKREREIIKNVFDNGDYYEKYFDSGFTEPLDKIVLGPNRLIGGISSPYGIGHDGIDLVTLDPKTGKHRRPVKAMGSGKIALIAKSYTTEGNMIIIDHGSGIFSICMHLSSFKVDKVGKLVNKGQIIAISGDTGNAKRGGPHLHCAIKIRDINRTQDVYVDPLAFIETMNQFK